MTETTERPARAIEAVECAPWCVYGDGHTEVAFRVDQVCFGAERRVELSLHPFIENEVMDAKTGDWRSAPDYVTVYAARRPEQAEIVEMRTPAAPRCLSRRTRPACSSSGCATCSTRSARTCAKRLQVIAAPVDGLAGAAAVSRAASTPSAG